VLAPTPFAHQINVRLLQCCFVLVGVYLAMSVVCRRFWCFFLGVLVRDYRASRHGRPLGWGWVCCDDTRCTGACSVLHRCVRSAAVLVG